MGEVLSIARLQTLTSQPDRLLLTKLFAPRARADRVPRPRLTARLDAGLRCKMTLISAPAGFGKTTLLSEWREAHARSDLAVAWVSLDKADNDLTRFLTYLIAALQTIRPDLGAAARATLETGQATIDVVLTSLINDLAAIDREAAIVLDDAHVIESPAILDAIDFLLDHLPPYAHVFVASRTDLPLALSRLRARNQLAEVRAADLRFTPDEAGAFLNHVMRLNLSPADVTALLSSTEGWAAGLQLAALSWQQRADQPEHLRAITGSDRYVLDYLMEEVLQRQTEDVQTFLLQTAILDRLCAPLCEAVTGRANAAALLELLDRSNLFIVPLDNQRRWYRYHHLFGELLRGRLQQWQPDHIAALHRRASDWCATNDLPREAIQHALAAPDPERAIQLIEPLARDMLGRNESQALHDWLSVLPAEALLAQPSLALKYAWTLNHLGRYGEAWAWLDQLADVVHQRPGLHSEWLAVRGACLSLTGRYAQARELLAAAWNLAPVDATMLRGVIALNRGVADMMLGDIAGAARIFADAAELGQAAGNLRTAFAALNNLAAMQTLLGQLHRSAETYRRALALAQVRLDNTPAQQAIAAMLHIGLAETLYEWNDLDGAWAETRLVFNPDEPRTIDEQAQLAGYLISTRILQARGEDAEAQRMLADGLRFGEQCASKWHIHRDLQALQARRHVQRGELAAAQAWADDACWKVDATDRELRARCLTYHTLARLWLAQASARAVPLLDRLAAAFTATAQAAGLIETRLLLALAYQRLGHGEAARAALKCALQLGAPENFIRIFADEGRPLAALLTELRSTLRPDETALSAYIERILAAMRPAVHESAAGRAGADSLIEPLSEREWVILQHIAAGLSNQEIAHQLIVAVSTIKWHINNIYAKLNVHSRTLALARARELGLL